MPNSINKIITETELQKALDHIHNYWPRLKKEVKKDQGSLIGLPHPYIVPADNNEHFKFDEQYYWDSYFTALGLQPENQEELVKGMLDNLIDLYNRFGVIPNASRMYLVGRSQPPLLTTYIFHVYDTYDCDLKWLKERIEIAVAEYKHVWMSQKHPHWRNVHKGLSRYYDVNVLHDLAEAESGWDMTPRFKRRCLDYLPIDLNSLLYKYEMDFSKAYQLLGDEREAKRWSVAAAKRQSTIHALMWSKRRAFYFDYNYSSKKRGSEYSLAAYYTMWAGLASKEQAIKLVEQLIRFKQSGGLSTTGKSILDFSLFGSVKAQWAYPNGWAPLHYIVIEGLERYGFHDHARELAALWLATNLRWFNEHGTFQEKYNVVDILKPPNEGLYPSQTGFGWTNGVFVYLAQKYFLSTD